MAEFYTRRRSRATSECVHGADGNSEGASPEEMDTEAEADAEAEVGTEVAKVDNEATVYIM